jgi:hypothetical protein
MNENRRPREDIFTRPMKQVFDEVTTQAGQIGSTADVVG